VVSNILTTFEQVRKFYSQSSPLRNRIYAPPWETTWPMVHEMWDGRSNRDSNTGHPS